MELATRGSRIEGRGDCTQVYKSQIIQLVVWNGSLYGLTNDGSLWYWCGDTKSVWEFVAPGKLVTAK